MMRVRLFQALAVGLLVLFWGVSYLEWFALDSFSAYAIYGFEIIFALGVTLLFRPLEWKKTDFTFGTAVVLFFALTSGFAVYEFASVLGHTIPYDLNSTETTLFVLLMAPLLEEWVFRGAIWRLIEKLIPQEWAPFVLTSALYSYSHYRIIGSVPELYQGFVHYQAMYTFGLALFCGGMRMHFGLMGAVATHLAFNWGFWVAHF